MESEKIVLGQIVSSKAGRDRDKYFMVVGIISNEYVLISDGDLRKIEKPKKKKVKHLVFHNMISQEIKSKIDAKLRVNDVDIRNYLKLIGLTNQSNSKEV